MNDYTPEVGHRVRVVLEGVVWRQNECDAIELHLKTGKQDWQVQHLVLNGEGVTFERLPDPEPEWQPGDVVLDATGRTFLRGTDPEFPWVLPRTEPKEVPGLPEFRHVNRHIHGGPTRPLTPLVRDGKPWAEATGGAS